MSSTSLRSQTAAWSVSSFTTNKDQCSKCQKVEVNVSTRACQHPQNLKVCVGYFCAVTATQFNCIFMSFHGDAWTKKNQPCSYCSQLPVSWETVVEVYGEEQEAHRHFSPQWHCKSVQGDVIQQTQPHNPARGAVAVTHLCITLTYASTFIPEIICL